MFPNLVGFVTRLASQLGGLHSSVIFVAQRGIWQPELELLWVELPGNIPI